MVKRWKYIVALAGVSWMLWSAGEVSAFEPYYLNGDKTLPMIQNTGGIYNDGATGLFMDLSTLTIEDVFSDGLAVKVDVSDMSASSVLSVQTLHIRFADNGKSWILRHDGKWQEVSEGSEDPAALAIYFTREAMGDETRREDLTSQIEKITSEKQEDAGSVVPADAIPLPIASPAPKTSPSVQGETGKNKKVAKAQKPSNPNVTVTITEAPKVEIVHTPDVQVDIE